MTEVHFQYLRYLVPMIVPTFMSKRSLTSQDNDSLRGLSGQLDNVEYRIPVSFFMCNPPCSPLGAHGLGVLLQHHVNRPSPERKHFPTTHSLCYCHGYAGFRDGLHSTRCYEMQRDTIRWNEITNPYNWPNWPAGLPP